MSDTAANSADVGIIILAAGSSERFCDDKRLALMPNGGTLLETTLASVPASIEKRVLVLRAGDDALAARFSARGWGICMCPDAHLGMGHSLSDAIGWTGNWCGALIGLADMPFVQAQTYTRLQQALTRHAIVVPQHDGKRGHPVGFDKQLFPELATLQGDEGARLVLERHQDVIETIDTDDAGILQDIDTQEALEEFQKQYAKQAE